MFGQQQQSGWGQPQQQPQQQQPTNAFGQPAQPQQNAFGGSTFGQQPSAWGQQQPQQQTNAFGQPQQQSSAFGQPSASAFGQTTAASAFGQPAQKSLFGQPAAAATTNAFGQPTQPAGFGQPSTSAFGSTSTNAFGGATNAFGFGQQQQRPSAFGAPAAATSAFGAASATPANPDVPPQGTLNPAYVITSERDTSGTTPVTHNYHAITCMPAYKGASFEELRLMDYIQNRKGPTAGSFGQQGGFGASTSTNAFNQPAATNAFGQPAAGTTAFGQPSTTAFGQPAASSSTFGQPTTNAFGQPQQASAFAQPAAGTSTFGQQQPAQSAFGQPTTASAFGQQPASNAFGLNQPKPFGSTFGQPAQAGASTFGQPAQGASTFGQPAAASTFGQPATSAFAQQGAASAFGQPQQPAAGAFGQQPQQGTSTFGQAGSAFGQAGASAFGQPQQNQQQQQPQQGALGTGPSPFSFPPAGQTNPAGTSAFGGFGSTATAAKPSIFGQPVAGTQPTSTGLFSNQTQQNQPTNTFGQPAQPATTGFNLFGQNNQNQQQAGQTTSLFGQPPQQATTSLFGSQQPAQQSTGLGAFGQAAKPTFGTFGTSTAQPNPLQASTAPATSSAPTGGIFGSLSQSVTTQPSRVLQGSHFGDNAFFQDVMNAPKTTLSSISPERENKKAPLLHSLRSSMAPTRSASPMKLRPYGSGANSPLTLSRVGTPELTSSTSLSRSTLTSPHPILAGISEGTKILSPGAFVSRPSAKKLMIEGDSLTPSPAALPAARPTFDASLEVQAANGVQTAPTVPSTPTRPTNGGRAQPTTSPAKSAEKGKSATPAVEGEGDYWCKPTVDELAKLPFSGLTHVENFTVGRTGYGQVRFLNPVDLTAVGNVRDIPGKIVVFNPKECMVYPNEDEKPSEGEGLNVPAEISLDNCWPTNKATGEPITDIKHKKMDAHIMKIKKMPETKFINFSDKGVWTFQVQHFSRYGLGDDEEEEEEEAAAAPPPPSGRGFTVPSDDEEPSVARAATMDPIEEEEEEDEPPQTSLMDEDIRSQRTFEDNMSMDTPRGLSPVDEEYGLEDGEQTDMQSVSADRHAWPSKLNLEPRKVHQMQASFFRAYDEPTPMRDSKYDRSSAFAQVIRESQMKKDLRALAGKEDMEWEDDDYTRAESAPPYEPMSDFVPGPPPVPTFALPNGLKGHEGAINDASLMLGRSFRVSWGPHGQLVHLGKLTGAKETKPAPDHVNTVKISYPPVLADDESKETEQTKRMLDLHVDHTDFTPYDGPSAFVQPSLSFASFSTLFSSEDHSHEALVWRLGEALWDHIPNSQVSHDLSDAVQDLLQRQAISDWLEGASLTTVESDLRDQISSDQTIFTLMTGHLIERACKSAMDANDLRLATLIAQASGSDMEFRRSIQQQLELWKESHVDAQITEDYRKIYSLLAGDVLLAEGNADSADRAVMTQSLPIASSLDWKRAFGLFFWYGSRFEARFEDVFHEFEGVQDMPETIPWYEEQKALASSLRKWRVASAEAPNDALFSMLRLKADHDPNPDVLSPLEDVLAPLGFSTSPLDLRTSWHLCVLFTQVKQIGTFRDSANNRSETLDRLVVSYALQVERLGLWKYAALVYLHLSLPESREKAIVELLTRNAEQITAEEEVFLLEKLQLPETWIAEAKAVLAHYERRTYDEYEFLLKAGRQAEAHDIAVRYLAPEAFLRKDWGLLRRIFEVFDPAAVPSWATHGGKVFLDYLDTFALPDLIRARASNAQMDAVQRSQLQRLGETVLRLMDLLPSVLSDHSNLAHNVCLNEMLVDLSQYLNILPTLGFKRPDTPSQWVEEASQLKMIQQDTLRSFDALLAAVSA